MTITFVNTETGIPDGSTRVYGTWNATHVKTGKEVNLSTYHSGWQDFSEVETGLTWEE